MVECLPRGEEAFRTQERDENVSCDTILNGGIRLFQPRKGHRAGTDAVLLAAAVPAGCSGFALDIGAGVGTIGLILAMRNPLLRVGLVENDPLAAGLATDNLTLNGLDSRGALYQADIFSNASRDSAGLAPGMADLVVTNPPFADAENVRASPLPGRRSAHVMVPGETKRGGAESGEDLLAAWIKACLVLLAPGGTFLMIHQPEALPSILAACSKRIGAIGVLPVLPQKDKAAKRIIVRGKKGSRAPFALAPPFVLQERGRFTPLAEEVHRGTALIEW